MTREEAIEILEEVRTIDDSMYQYNEKYLQALDMAIKALEQTDVLDKIREEFITKYPKNYMGEPELGGAFCAFSLSKVLDIIDKYRKEEP